MKSVLIWLAVFYAAFKLPGMVLARYPGFGPRELSFRDRLRASEPWLFLAALFVSVPLVLLMKSYAWRTHTGQYVRAVECQGRIAALKDLPAIRRSADAYAVYETVQGYRTSAYRNGAPLGMTTAEVAKALAEGSRASGATFEALRRRGQRQEMRAEVARTLHCLHPPPDPPNA